MRLGVCAGLQTCSSSPLDLPAMGRFILLVKEKGGLDSYAQERATTGGKGCLRWYTHQRCGHDRLTGRVTGFNAKAIRYYEQIGILPPSSRGKNGYRQYSQADINRLNLLRRLRLLGISLEEAKTLWGVTLDAPCYEVQHDLLHLVNARLATIDQEIAELHHLREEVVRCQQQLVVSAVEKDEPFTVLGKL